MHSMRTKVDIVLGFLSGLQPCSKPWGSKPSSSGLSTDPRQLWWGFGLPFGLSGSSAGGGSACKQTGTRRLNYISSRLKKYKAFCHSLCVQTLNGRNKICWTQIQIAILIMVSNYKHQNQHLLSFGYEKSTSGFFLSFINVSD